MGRGGFTLVLLFLSLAPLLLCSHAATPLRRGCVASPSGGRPLCRPVEHLSQNARRHMKSPPPDRPGSSFREKEQMSAITFWKAHNKLVEVLTNDTQYVPTPKKLRLENQKRRFIA